MSRDVKPKVLPRGLVNRDGAAVQTSQRMPSLRGDALTNTSALTSNHSNSYTPLLPASNTTRGGAVKRVFKPNIAATARRVQPTAASSTETKKTRGGGRSPSKTPRDNKSQGRRPPYKNNTIQLDASVFNGIDAVARPATESNARGSSRETVTRVAKPTAAPVSNLKLGEEDEEDPRTSVDNLFRDDFIDDSDDESEAVAKKPMAWENVCEETASHSRAEATERLSGIPIDKWMHDEDKLVLFQVPDLLVNRPQGLVGKLRVYKSGRVELIDAESNIVFDVVRANNSPSADMNVRVKSEDSTRQTRKEQARDSKSVQQELVTMSEQSLTCLGSVDNSEIFISVPRLPPC